MHPDTANSVYSTGNFHHMEVPEDEVDSEGLSVLRIVLGYFTTLALTLASAVAISGYAPEVVTTIAGI